MATTPPPPRPFKPGRRPNAGWGRTSIAADIAHQIDTGQLPPGTKLPSRAQLAALYANESGDVSETTIMRALDPLMFTGRVRGEQGRGVYVVGPAAVGGQ